MSASSSSESELLIRTLETTSRIFHNHAPAQKGQPTLFETVSERELGMKERFMEDYRRAERARIVLPGVILKLGHWHILHGICLSIVSTTGEFADPFAFPNGMQLFPLSTYVVDGLEPWENDRTFDSLVVQAAPFGVIEFRPLRPFAFQNKIQGLTDAWRLRVFRILVIRGGETGTYVMVGGKGP